MKYIRLERTDDGIVLLTIDSPGSKVNAVSSGLLDDVGSVIKDLAGDRSVKALVVMSAKDGCFVAGADLYELRAMKTAEQVNAYITKAHAILNTIENMKIPVIACINGTALGGGFEITLVCSYRIAVDSSDVLVGLPEVNFGLLPAGGGCQRLPRLVGLTAALPMMLAGRTFRAKKAKRAGLVDEVVPVFGLREMALKRARELVLRGIPRRRRRRTLAGILLESNPVGRAVVFSQARKMVTKKTYGCYPAPYAIIDAVEHGMKKGMRAGLLKEMELFGKLVVSHESKSLISLFEGMTALKKNTLKKQAKSTGKLAIIGTGFMGQGIASVSVPVCDTVLMKDTTADTAARGINEVWQGLVRRVKSGALLPFERDVQYGRLIACGDYSMFRNTDLVVEAVFEDLDLKRKILAEVESCTDGRTIFASNTSAIPISDIAKGCRRPANVIGMHYFSPVPKMPLLEIIVTPRTAKHVAASVLDFGISQGKTCIVVKDGPGFYTTRILAPMLNEVMLLIEEGAVPNDIDRAMRRFGYPVGPAALIDEVGIDVGAHVFSELGPVSASRGYPVSQGIPRLYAEGYCGRKNGKGIYRYDLDKRKGARVPDERVYAILGGAGRRSFDERIIQQRVSLMMINEAMLCLQDGTISTPRDGDIGAVFGLGFPPFHGGPFRYIDYTGAAEVVRTMDGLEKEYGLRFRPAKILADMARRGGRFYKD